MQIVEVKISDIKPYKNNPRYNDYAVEKVANSINAFGFQQPIVLDNDNTIVVGHTRYKAALSLGFSSVPCLYASDLSEAQINAYRLADNKTAEIAKWDAKKLAEELSKIPIDIPMVNLGFIEGLESRDIEEIPEPVLETSDKKLRCPKCGYVDFKDAFKEVKHEIN